MECDENSACLQAWTQLEKHFCFHALPCCGFCSLATSAVLDMWKARQMGAVSDERVALVEHHCKLFGSWPT